MHGTTGTAGGVSAYGTQRRRRSSTPTAWTRASVRHDLNHEPPGALLRQVEALADVPPELQSAAWPYLVAVAVEASARLPAVSIADGLDGAGGRP